MAMPEGFESWEPSEQLEFYGRKMARDAGLDPELIGAIGTRESGWNQDARGRDGEIGAMQIMPSTGRALGYSPADLTDPVTNLTAGVKLLSQLNAKYEGDPHRIAMAYNAGEGAVDRGAVPLSAKGYGNAIVREMTRQQQALAGESPTAKAVDIPEGDVMTRQIAESGGIIPALGGSIVGKGRALAAAPGALMRGEMPSAEALTGALDLATMLPLGPGLLLKAPKMARVAIAALNGGAALSDALDQEVDDRRKNGETSGTALVNSFLNLSAPDAAVIGASTIMGGVMPGITPKSIAAAEAGTGIRRAGRKLLFGGTRTAEAERVTRESIDAAIDKFPMPPHGAATKPFDALDQTLEIDTTQLKKIVGGDLPEGLKLPPGDEVIKSDPVHDTVMTSIHGLQPLPVPITRTVEKKTGVFKASSAEVYNWYRDLGATINLKDFRVGKTPFQIAYLKDIRAAAKDEILRSVGKVNASEAQTFSAALDTSRMIRQQERVAGVVMKAFDAETGFANPKLIINGIKKYRVDSRDKMFGAAGRKHMVQFANDIKRLQAKPPGVRFVASLGGLLAGAPAFLGVYGSAGGLAGISGIGLAAFAAGYMATRIATNPALRSTLSKLARTPTTSKRFEVLAGRLAAAAYADSVAELSRTPPPTPTGGSQSTTSLPSLPSTPSQPQRVPMAP